MWRIAVLGLVLASSAGSVAGPLRAPFDVAARRAAHGAPETREASPTWPAPVIDVEVDAYYADDAHSEVDHGRKSAHDATLAPLRDYYRAMSRLANRYVRTSPEDPALAAAALDGLVAWADAGALLGKTSQQGEYQRGWALGALALAYLEVRDAPGLDPNKRERVTRWLAAIARQVTRTRSNTDARRKDFRNNHRYWSAAAVAAAAVAADDRELWDWAIASYELFVADERAGLLPLELTRGARALHYHLFALEALELLAELAGANHVDLRAEHHALDRLVDRCIGALADRRSFPLTGQDVTDPPAADEAAWIGIERAHRTLAARVGTLDDPLIGGDTTLLFGP